MQTIILARHGLPVWDFHTPIAGRDLGNWMAGYDGAPLDRAHPPPNQLISIARASDVLVTSTMRRSVESMQLVAADRSVRSNAVFCEVALPAAIHSAHRLRPQLWTTWARIRWYGGWSPDAPSWPDARVRAEQATLALIDLASPSHQVLLVGHGLLNRMIGRRLWRLGFSGPLLPPRSHWSFSQYRRG